MLKNGSITKTIADRWAAVRWFDHLGFESDGIVFHIMERQAGITSDLPSVVIGKTPDFFDAYAAELGDAATGNVVDLGVWEGGSALAIASLFGVKKLVAIDIKDPVESFDILRANHPLGDKISVHYRTSQDDYAALEKILAEQFDGPLDVVIDDASHDNDLTARSFNFLFPRLRPGGWYVIEDWAWAHHAGWPMMRDRPAMTNFILRLIIAQVARPDLFDRVVVRPDAVFLQKNPTAPMGGVIDIESCCELDGRTLPLF